MRVNPLPLFLIGAPLAEIVAFGLVVQWLGFWSAFALVLLTSAIGLLIVRHQGFGLISKISAMAREGRPPAGGMGGDLLTLIGGLLLLLPGFLTDILGLALFIPFVRHRLSRMSPVKTRVYTAGTYTETYGFEERRSNRREDGVVDLDRSYYERTDAEKREGQGELPDL